MPFGIRTRRLQRARASSTSLILDTITGATCAYSLRKLRSAYSGSCVRVRRSSDNAEQDIGFLSNVIDESSLLSFTGANDGFIATWYDQSGGSRDLTQSTASKQPKIVSSGAIVAGVASKISADFDGTDDQLFTAVGVTIADIITASAYTAFTVFEADAIDTGTAAPYQYDGVWNDSGGYMGLHLRDTSSASFYNWDTHADIASRTMSTGTDYLSEARHESGTIYHKLNAGTETSTASSDTGSLAGRLVLGGYTGGSSPYFNGRTSEVIFFSSALSSGDRTTVSNDVMGFYGL